MTIAITRRKEVGVEVTVDTVINDQLMKSHQTIRSVIKIAANPKVALKAVIGAVVLMIGVFLLAGCGEAAPSVAAGPVIDLYKSPTCQCCSKWATHLEQAGFNVKIHDQVSLSRIKTSAGVPLELRSCHTAMVDGYAIEGHVPAGDIRRLLATRLAVKGLAVPGMPIDSPGMEQGDRHELYDVIAFDAEGETTVFASH